MRDATDIIKQFFDREIIAEGEEWIGFISSWEKMVGTDLAAHLTVKDIKNGVLLLNCDHPGWAQIFYIKKTALLRKIKKQFPRMDIRSFRVFCGKENINRELLKNARLIEEYREESDREDLPAQDEEFSSLLQNLRNLGD
ncbi:MAG: DUF721 domain-containing protein [Spirochaetales bacterium]|nr:DUF721 domain-containing protein [Spirochaetales bacterium]